ncbi:MAG: ATP-binding cassette domain-containing protein [Planctomycetota bacterium]|nr:ATP-binding cassette domain-containing protein [Planctomycetota bacterium]
MPVVQLHGITVAFGGPPILDAVDLTIDAGERLCLLGRNGAGKSTLLKVVAGLLEPDDGRVVRAGRIAVLDQRVPDDLDGSVLDLVLAGADAPSEHKARAAISRVGLDADAQLTALSAGLKRRALLARALAGEPELLLLDEPTNHLDVDSIEWLETFLRRQAKTLLFVTHDRALLRKLATGILDLDRGHVTRYEADYERYIDRKQGRLDTETQANAQFDKKLAEEEVWIRRGVRERRKRNMGRVRELRAMRAERSERREQTGSVRMQSHAAGTSGRNVMRATDVDYAWEGQPIVRGLTTTIQRGDKVGIIGPNGSGKTTVIRLLLGEIQPDAGVVRQGTNLEIAYFDQLHAALDESASAAENVNPTGPNVTVGGKERSVISYLRDFLFTADQARGSIRDFSGGERNRLLLARLFAQPSNVLVLDEPTNDLDVETLAVLEDLLVAYEGTVLVVSHDRELLDNVVTSTLVLEGDGAWGEYVGGYADWLTQRKPSASAKPKTSKRARRGPRVSPLDKQEKQELRTLPGRIEKLEAEQAALHAQMADPAFFTGPGERIAEATARMKALEGEIAGAYERWEALEAKRAGPADASAEA